MKDSTTRAEALELLFSHWTPVPETEVLPLEEAVGRIAAETLYAKYNIPSVRASEMDGVAVISERFASGTPRPEEWKLGEDYARADTGDDFDDRFDAVIRVEDVDLLPEGGFRLHEEVTVEKGMNIRGAGTTIRKGVPLSEAGLPLRGSDLAAIAMGGHTEVRVIKCPRVTFIPTGSELLPLGEPMQRGCNYNTNGLMAKCMLREMGAEAEALPIIKDDPAALEAALHAALADSDIVIINGGSSKGDEDFNTRLLRKEGELLFHGVAAGPGRPMSIAVIQGKPVINLPGPAMAAFYGLDWCIRPIVCRCLGIPVPERRTVTGRLTSQMTGARHVDFLNRVEVTRKGEEYLLRPLSRGKAELPELLRSNALYVSPIGEGYYDEGTELTVELLRDPSLLPRWKED